MDLEHRRYCPKDEHVESFPVPPGFASLTSFTLKRVERSEETMWKGLVLNQDCLYLILFEMLCFCMV